MEELIGLQRIAILNAWEKKCNEFEQLEQQSAKLLAIVKELIEIGDKKYYETCDFSSDVYGLAEKAEITLAEVNNAKV